MAALLVALPSEAAETETVRGRLTQVDAAAGRLTVAGQDGPIILALMPTSRLEVDGKAATLAALKEGTYVRAVYKKEDGANRILSIRPAVVTDEELRRRVDSALTATRQYAHQQKDEYAAKVRGLLDDLDDRIDRLQAEMKQAGEEAKARLAPRLEALKKQRAALGDRLAKVRAAAAEAWEDVKAGFGAAARDLKQALRND